MAGLTLIQKLPHLHVDNRREVKLPADRATLAKRRWRGVAEDGREFGFDLDATLVHGTPFFAEEQTIYVIEQLPEPVIEIPVATTEEAARVAWNLGNLHFGVQVLPGAVRVPEDPAVIQFLAREGIKHARISAVFLPLSAASSHHHHHHEHAHVE
jgi:urease accessory protein